MPMDEKEREVCLHRMRAASSQFYLAATNSRNHAFVEFCGLMNEYIKVCEDAHRRGEDFTDFNAHLGQHLPVAPHQLQYINEKMECIYGLQLAPPEAPAAAQDLPSTGG